MPEQEVELEGESADGGSAGKNVATFTTGESKLPSKIQKLTTAISWTGKDDEDSEVFTETTGGADLFVTAGTPAGDKPTC